MLPLLTVQIDEKSEHGKAVRQTLGIHRTEACMLVQKLLVSNTIDLIQQCKHSAKYVNKYYIDNDMSIDK